jgi:hypothetical protein
LFSEFIFLSLPIIVYATTELLSRKFLNFTAHLCRSEEGKIEIRTLPNFGSDGSFLSSPYPTVPSGQISKPLLGEDA